MAAVFLSPLYILLLVYLVCWSLRWLAACSPFFKKEKVKTVVIAVWILLASSPVVSFFLPGGTLIRRVVGVIGNYWLGVTLYLALAVALFDLARVILRHIKRVDKAKLGSRKTRVAAGGLCVLLVAAVSLYGVINAGIIRTTPYEITVNKDGGRLDSLKIVLVADLHLGYNVGKSQMTQMVEKINAQDADLVVIAGDLFDNDYDAMDNPAGLVSVLKGIQSRYGVYACYGNHDIEEKILAGFTFDEGLKKVSDPRMDAFLDQAGIQLLKDESVLVEGSFYLYGRPDYARPGRGVGVRKTPAEITAELDCSKPIIVIDHEPKELLQLADAGVDVDLCGHTHDGQVFPGNLIIRLFWENSCGYLLKGRMHNIVTSGVGLFGPNMRVGTIPEICPVTIHFEP